MKKAQVIWMKNKNLAVIAALIVVIAAAALAAARMPRRVKTLPEGLVQATAAPEESLAPSPTAAPEESVAPSPTVTPARGYVLVSTATDMRWLPLPESGEDTIAVRQTRDGEKLENVLHLTPDGIYMESSTCEGQDCVKQGEVTLENRHERVLRNMIVCLPQQVTLELYTPEEILQMVSQTQGAGAQ